MRWLAVVASLLALVPLPGKAADPPSSRVIVSATLNSTLSFLDASTLEFTQLPLVSRGLGPVRMVVTYDGCPEADCNAPRLFTANHGAAGGSVGMFDLSGAEVVEMPTSPFPARAGAVGIDAARVTLPGGEVSDAVVVTNTYFALGGCDLPAGSVTAFERFLVSKPGLPGPSYLETMREAGTVELTGAIPYAVAIAGPVATAYASTNCGDSLEELRFDYQGFSVFHPSFTVAASGNNRSTSPEPDGVVYDPVTNRVFVVSISGSSIASFPPGIGAMTGQAPLPGARPIDVTLANSRSGGRWLITSNGGNDTISILDRFVLASCVTQCAGAVLATIPTGVPGGAPEGVAYDPVSNRVFVVNKIIGAPSLTAIQLAENGSTVSGAAIKTVPLPTFAFGDIQVPNLIAFDVVVQTR